eukprot:846126_1
MYTAYAIKKHRYQLQCIWLPALLFMWPSPFSPTHTSSQSYIYHPDSSLSWADSNAYCEASYGTTLASIHNDAQNDEAGTLCPSSAPLYGCWVGGHNANSAWEWLDGTPFDYGSNTAGGVAPWAVIDGDNQPDNSGGNEDCLEIRQDSNTWNDRRCDDE